MVHKIMPSLKETKAQRAERLKRAKNAWDHLEEIRAFARDGYSSVPPEWFSTYFRPWGIYSQGDGQGVIGGTGGEGKSVPYFMVRIRIPNGLLTSAQVREIAKLSSQHGNGVADITVRQNIQLHWVKIESIPDVLDRLRVIGLTTTGACGDVTRNITGCPLAGVHAHEIADVSDTVLALDRELGGNPEFYNLPRKYKITVTGCPDWCSYPEINDIALTAVLRRRRTGTLQDNHGHGGRTFSSDVIPTDANGASAPPELVSPSFTTHHSPALSGAEGLLDPAPYELGFSVRVGGGLSTQPHLAVRLNAFIKPQQVIRVVRAITEIFRESEVLRQSREKARLKFLFLEHGWTADSFLAAVHRKLGFALDPAVEPEQLPAHIHRDHLGVIPQKQPGLFTVGASVVRGRITPAQLTLAADLAERYGDGRVRNTAMQNLLLVNISGANVHHVVHELSAAGLPVDSASPFTRGTVACTGSEFCKLALTETKSFARWLTEQLEDRFPNYREDLRLHITGCPNSCGQHWIADIGIEGKKIKYNGQMVDAYYFCVGGSVGQIASIARPIGYRCPASDVPDAIAHLLDHFHAHRQPGEPLQHFLARTSTPAIRHILAGGGPTELAERDLALAAAPHSVEDR
jgi:sulfite reductase (ferredoxin)